MLARASKNQSLLFEKKHHVKNMTPECAYNIVVSLTAVWLINSVTYQTPEWFPG